MELKCATFSDEIKSKIEFVKPKNNILEFNDIEIDNKYHAFKMIIPGDKDQYGALKKGGKTQSLPKFLSENGYDDIGKVKFVIINTETLNIYYDCNGNNLRKILNEVYNIKSKFIKPEIDLAQLQFLEHLTVIRKEMKQTNLFEFTQTGNAMMLKELAELGIKHSDVDKEEFKIYFRKGFSFPKKISKLVDENSKKDTWKLSFRAKDKEGNVINYNDKFSKKIVLLEHIDDKTWELRESLKLRTIINALKDREEM